MTGRQTTGDWTRVPRDLVPVVRAGHRTMTIGNIRAVSALAECPFSVPSPITASGGVDGDAREGRRNRHPRGSMKKPLIALAGFATCLFLASAAFADDNAPKKWTVGTELDVVPYVFNGYYVSAVAGCGQ
jgi:hypothetical protein